MGGKFDKSFNQGVYDGVERFKAESGIEYREFEVTNETQREQALRRMAQRGANPILGVGFAQAGPMETVAKEFPDTKFTIIDGVVNLPNVQSVVFKEHEGSFLVGLLAAMASEATWLDLLVEWTFLLSVVSPVAMSRVQSMLMQLLVLSRT